MVLLCVLLKVVEKAETDHCLKGLKHLCVLSILLMQPFLDSVCTGGQTIQRNIGKKQRKLEA